MSDGLESADELMWHIRQDLVERLRIQWEGMGEVLNVQRAEAAFQIDMMMDELEDCKQAVQNAERDIATLRAERDEARRAKRRAWDCFKEKP